MPATPTPLSDTPTPQAPAAATVLLDDSGLTPRFSPRAVEVAAGGTVTWQWSGVLPHDVTGPGFASGIKSEGTFSVTFPLPGTYQYVCELHASSNMRGTVTVR